MYGNTIKDCRAYGVKIMSSPQGQICGNDIELPDNDDDDDDDVSFCTERKEFTNSVSHPSSFQTERRERLLSLNLEAL